MNELNRVQQAFEFPPPSACDDAASSSSAAVQLSGEELLTKNQVRYARRMREIRNDPEKYEEWKRQRREQVKRQRAKKPKKPARFCPRVPKTPVSSEELGKHFSNLRNGATQLVPLPNMRLLSRATISFFAVCYEMRRHQITHAKSKIRFRQRPDAKEITRQRNHCEDGKAARRAHYERVKSDPVLMQKRRGQGAASFQKHKQTKYDYRNKRRAEDPQYRISGNLRTYMYQKIGMKRGNEPRFAALVGCSTEELCRHLERQFKQGMTWKNYGSIWEVDHKVPCAAYDLTDPDQQKLCFHYTNLVPEWSHVNHSKSDLLPDGTRARFKKRLNAPSEVLSKGE